VISAHTPVSVVALVGALVAALASAPAAVTTPRERGVTRTTVTVGGLVAPDLANAGADLGARARFARAGRVGGRRIQYLGVASAADPAAVARLTTDAFAVVPAVGVAEPATVLARAGLPFVGVAADAAWSGNVHGFGITGSAVGARTRQPNPAWGLQLRALLGGSKNKGVAIITDDPRFATSVRRPRRATRPATMQDAGFTVTKAIVLPQPPAPVDMASTAQALVTSNPAVVLVLASAPTVLALAQQLAALGYVGTVATEDVLYAPDAPGVGAGLTILVTIAPNESGTPALRRMIADVHAADPSAAITPQVVQGYFSADFFLRALARVGTRVTARRFLDAANRDSFVYEVAGTIGRSTWPAMHTRAIPCGALVQGDGTRYVVAEPYRCAADVTPPAKR